DRGEAWAGLASAGASAQLGRERESAGPPVHDSHVFAGEGGRHPVVEQALSRDGTPFVANDCDPSPPQDTGAGRIWLITGPNMAGETTVLRQKGVIAILPRIGKLRPAQHAPNRGVDRQLSLLGGGDAASAGGR